MKRDDVVDGRGPQVLGIADDAAAVRVRDERGAIHQLVEHAVGLGQDALIVFTDHHVARGVNVRFGDVERAEPVGFGPQQRLEIIRRDDLVVVGDVVGRKRVVHPADVLGQPVDRLGRGVARPLEHQVLEEVRESGAAGRIVFAADAVPHVDRDRGNAVVLDHQDA